MKVSVELLKEHNACTEHVELFEKFLGDRKYVLLTSENFQLAKNFGLDVGWVIDNLMTIEHQQVVIDSGDAIYCYLFARHIDGADISALQKVVIDSGDAIYCYLFAEDIEGADISALQKVVIDSGDVRYCYMFARHVKGADISALQKAVIDSGDVRYCCLFAQYVKGADVNALQKVIDRAS